MAPNRNRGNHTKSTSTTPNRVNYVNRMTDNEKLKNDTFITENWCHTHIRKIHHCSYKWIIHNYFDYHYHSKQFLNSSVFKSTTNDEHEWCLQLTVPKSNVIKLFLILLRPLADADADTDADNAPGGNVSVKCKIFIMNNEGRKTNVHEQIHFNRLCKENISVNPRYYLEFNPLFTSNDVTNKKIFTGDKLIIFCEFQFIISGQPNAVTNIVGKSVAVDESDLDSLSTDLEKLYLDKDYDKFCDFVISVDGKDYLVHKNILAVRSRVFAAMFEQDMKEQKTNRLEITDMRESVVDNLLAYIYTGRVCDWNDTSFELLQAAEKYDLQQLKNKCQYAIVKELSVENVVNCVILADLYRAPLLKDQAIQFLKIHSEEVMKTDSWSKLKESRMFDEVLETLLIK